jgi:hypothetical protein
LTKQTDPTPWIPPPPPPPLPLLSRSIPLSRASDGTVNHQRLLVMWCTLSWVVQFSK